METLYTARWIWWLALYAMAVILVPWVLVNAWMHQHKEKLRPKLSEMFQRAELGLVSVVFATAAIWDLRRSSYTFATVAAGSVLLGLCGVMAANLWVEHYCRSTTGARLGTERSWCDSRDIALLVFSVSTVAEMLIDRLAKVVNS